MDGQDPYIPAYYIPLYSSFNDSRKKKNKQTSWNNYTNTVSLSHSVHVWASQRPRHR